MNTFKLQQLTIKKINMLIEQKIGDKDRLEQIQMKIARDLPMFSENQAYVDSLVLDNLSDGDIESIKKDVESAILEKSELDEQQMFHCICCGNANKSLDNGGMCGTCYLDYNVKISRFITKPTGRMMF
ncbi:hypothetical protein [Nitrosopumilus sp.]|uniref:hypothetical protein n=1 Tax=Nitrosopumilus sp. TaxID=2024843 RepID=UPI00247C6067|nr:hypothetical protein [Nitrosopumilus sp.]MCV0431239.1 hypothetical protein [Nitrosopumilus sp.]